MGSSGQAHTVQASRDSSLTPSIAGKAMGANTTRPVRSSQPSTSPNIVFTTEYEATTSNQEQPRQASTSEEVDEVPISDCEIPSHPSLPLWERLLDSTHRDAISCLDGLEGVENEFKSYTRRLEEQISILNERNSRLIDQVGHCKKSEREYAQSARQCSTLLAAVRKSEEAYIGYNKRLHELVEAHVRLKAIREEAPEPDSHIRASDHEERLRAEEEEIQSLAETVEEHEAEAVKLRSVTARLMQIGSKGSQSSKDGG